MIINCDVTGLEIAGAAFLSQDAILMDEINRGVDIHSRNQEALGLPPGDEGRLVAKIFIFRMLYGGSEYGFIKDSLFQSVSSNAKYWRKVIDKFFDKYRGLLEYQNKIVKEVGLTSGMTMPTGRMYEWDLKKYGSFKIPEPQVKNYCVQGFGADLVSVVRVSFARRFRNAGIDGVLINTVHDSIVVDCAAHEEQRVAKMFHQVFADAPTNINRVFNIGFNLIVRCEVLGGPNQGELSPVSLSHNQGELYGV